MNRFTLDQLEAFIVCAELGSFSRAAKRLGKTQSTISSAINNLETDLGIELFDRSTRKPSLTLAGQELVAEAQLLIDNANRLYAKGLSISSGVETELSIAANEFMPYQYLQRTIETVQKQFPNLPFKLYQTALNEVRELVCNNKVHLGFATGAIEDNSVDFKPVGHISFTPVCPPNHPLANSKAISFNQINQHKQIMVFDQSNLADDVKRGVFSPLAIKVNNLSLKIELMKSGFGWGMLPSHIATQEINAGTLVELDLAFSSPEDIRLPIYLIWGKNKALGKATQYVIEQF